MLTEDEAKKKWCHQVNVNEVPPDIDGIVRPRCIGNLCMAWRWNKEKPVENDDAPFGSDLEYTGYCGLAGTR